MEMILYIAALGLAIGAAIGLTRGAWRRRDTKRRHAEREAYERRREAARLEQAQAAVADLVERYFPFAQAAWAAANGRGTARERLRLALRGVEGVVVGVADIGFVKGVTWGDINNDGLLDLYLSRFGQPNRLFRNEGPEESHTADTDGPSDPASWRFTDVTEAAGVAAPRLSFATWFWDYDNDGWLDLFVAPFSGFVTNSLWMPSSLAGVFFSSINSM